MSTTVAPAGATAPLSIDLIRPFSTITVDGPRSGWAASTISRPAWIAKVSALAAVPLIIAATATANILVMVWLPYFERDTKRASSGGKPHQGRDRVGLVRRL